jgi:formylglycine-generating enzyme required for sulfatase activity
VFYAGHGLQIKGENYLPAVDADISGEEDVPTQSLAMRQIMDVLEEAKTRLNLVFLDACRNNPYARSFRSASDGLNRVNAPSGTLISFATRPGSVAADGTGRNGLYTGALLEQMNNQNQPIEQVLKKVVSQVKTASNSQQEPWMEGSIEGEFCFGECGKQVAQSGLSDDRVFWESVKDSRDVNEIKAYLEQFPLGIFAGLARARLAALEKAGPQVSVSKLPQTIPPALIPLTSVLKAGSVFRDCDICPEMVVIPGGTFQMGSTATGFLGQNKPVSYETPQHEVSVKQFAIGKYEVTQEQWSAVMGTTPSRFTGTNLPVELVSWADANEYVKKLSEKTGKNYRLPTEAEWEYAARAGSQSAYSFGDSEFELEKFAWFNSTGFNLNGKSTKPVGGKLPNGFGLFDVHGNVFEWTQDCWNINYEGAPIDGTAWTKGDCSRRVIRGGSWVNTREGLRSASRDRSLLEARQDHYGLRVVIAP